MDKLGTPKRPLVLRVATEKRGMEIMEICNERGLHYIIAFEPDKPEDLSDLERVLNPARPAVAGPKIGRNDPCPCGSGKKYKKCCGNGTLPG
ncbi:PBPRA1643 family SWIM/SEC-C metal-binding motif protein [Heliomicrobium modesticaldum]|uniref:PBPRA1643 family SWIM/SEC-C metal-binding motif protein n=1 Tax=Heliomicrobium modesticaldum TaxID=35701 RepID=UPI00214F19FD|nr:PBPRA1643 family SWIM/SEC-C metal-binding motif protein [Heliomicrobium modesticaldum]